MLKKIKETSLVKDTESGAVLNTDYTGLLQYKKSRVNRRTMAQRINTLENDLKEIKYMVEQLLGKGKG